MAEPPLGLAVLGEPTNPRALARRLAFKDRPEPINNALDRFVDSGQDQQQGHAALKDELAWQQRIDVHLWIGSTRDDLGACQYGTIIQARADQEGVNLKDLGDVLLDDRLYFDFLPKLETLVEDVQDSMFIGVGEVGQPL
jgi:hypothetical protein